MLWLINQATAGSITSVTNISAAQAASAAAAAAPPKAGEEKKEGALAAGRGADTSFDGIKIDMNA
jgi:hypothetical protein